MTNARLESLVWVLIYGGLLLVVLGLAVQRQDASLGWVISVAGGAVAAVGAVLIVVRSRRKEDRS